METYVVMVTVHRCKTTRLQHLVLKLLHASDITVQSPSG